MLRHPAQPPPAVVPEPGLPAAGSTALSFGNPAGGTIPVSGSCTVSVNVTGTAPGAYQNVSDPISSSNGGTNTGPSGIAQATLTVLRPPAISKLFSPNPIPAGSNSTLTFSLSNPNQNIALTGISFLMVILPGYPIHPRYPQRIHAGVPSQHQPHPRIYRSQAERSPRAGVVRLQAESPLP